CAMRPATCRMRSRSATEVPPNFCTTSAIEPSRAERRAQQPLVARAVRLEPDEPPVASAVSKRDQQQVLAGCGEQPLEPLDGRAQQPLVARAVRLEPDEPPVASAVSKRDQQQVLAGCGEQPLEPLDGRDALA